MSQPADLHPSSQSDSVSPTTFGLFDTLGGDREEAAKRALEALKDVEKLGGSAAFEAWLKDTDNGTKLSGPILPDLDAPTLEENFAALNTQEKIYPITVFVDATWWTSKLRIEITDGSRHFVGEGSRFALKRTNVNLRISPKELYVYAGLDIDALTKLRRVFFQVRRLSESEKGVVIRFIEEGPPRDRDVASIHLSDTKGLEDVFGAAGIDFKFTPS